MRFRSSTFHIGLHHIRLFAQQFFDERLAESFREFEGEDDIFLCHFHFAVRCIEKSHVSVTAAFGIRSEVRATVIISGHATFL